MNDYTLSVLLGIVEGLTEFLPVSSTAHIRIVEGLCGIKLDSEYWKMYSVVIQLGAILSVVVYFWSRLWKFALTFPRGQLGNRTVLNHPLSLTLIAFLLTAGPSYLLDKRIGQNLENLWVIAIALLAGGAVMWIVDVVYTRPTTHRMDDMNLFQAIWIGLMQNLAAIFPGASRSMATIAAGQVVQMSRAAALEFSFFLSIPTMLAATGYKLLQAVRHHQLGAGDPLAPQHPWIVLTIGFVVSFIVALAVVAWFIHWVRRRGFVPFAVYRILLGIIILAWAWRSSYPAS